MALPLFLRSKYQSLCIAQEFYGQAKVGRETVPIKKTFRATSSAFSRSSDSYGWSLDLSIENREMLDHNNTKVLEKQKLC